MLTLYPDGFARLRSFLSAVHHLGVALPAALKAVFADQSLYLAVA